MSDDGSGSTNGLRGGITEAAHQGDERTTLFGFLQRQRDLVPWKLKDADEALLRATTTPSGLRALGLVRHLTNVERSWIRDDFRQEPGLVFDWSDENPDGEFDVPADVTLEQVLAEYAAETARCDAAVAGASLEDLSADGQGFSLRWILVHLIEETARHLGHLDLLRELADGSTGEDPAP